MEEALKQIKSNCKKIVLYGPESTGKTTLAIELAKYFDVPWVPEFAREYLQNVWDKEKRVCEPRDLIPIAKGQMELENRLSEETDSILICDTNLFETMVYSKYYYGQNCDPILEKYAKENHYDLYLLTNIDVPWVKDDLRDKPNERKEIFEYFKKTLEKYDKTYNLINGSFLERKLKSIEIIDKIINIVT